MSMNNPLADNAPTDHEDQALVMRARSGDRQPLEDLIERHQGWIYNIAVRMLYHPQDAEDATQEILVKVSRRYPASSRARLSFRLRLRAARAISSTLRVVARLRLRTLRATTRRSQPTAHGLPRGPLLQ
jgi:DNA-directed RNA polymerase specialized sigma24 family protein